MFALLLPPHSPTSSTAAASTCLCELCGHHLRTDKEVNAAYLACRKCGLMNVFGNLALAIGIKASGPQPMPLQPNCAALDDDSRRDDDNHRATKRRRTGSEANSDQGSRRSQSIRLKAAERKRVLAHQCPSQSISWQSFTSAHLAMLRGMLQVVAATFAEDSRQATLALAPLCTAAEEFLKAEKGLRALKQQVSGWQVVVQGGQQMIKDPFEQPVPEDGILTGVGNTEKWVNVGALNDSLDVPCAIPTARQLNVDSIVHRIQSLRENSLQKHWAQCTRRHFFLIERANCTQKLLLDRLLACMHDICGAPPEGETTRNSRYDRSKLGNIWQHREEEASQIVSVIQLLQLLVKTVAVSVNSALFPWS